MIFLQAFNNIKGGLHQDHLNRHLVNYHLK